MRYSEEYAKMHTPKEVVDDEFLEAASIGLDGPIDWEKLKSEIEEKGPLEIIKSEMHLSLIHI